MVELPYIYKIAIEACVEASELIMKYFDSQQFYTKIKQDNSPVTNADVESSDLIVSYLKQTKIPILSEEGVKILYEERKKWNQLWIVDPLDGTKEFIRGANEFTVNVGLVEKGKPIFGVIAHPSSRNIYFGGKAYGSRMYNYQSSSMVQAINLPIENTQPKKLIVTGGRKTSLDFYANSNLVKKEYENISFKKISSALKFCKIAEGYADIYPRDYPCMEWDTAAGHALVQGIGKNLYEINTKKEICYNKEDLYVPNFLLA